MLASCGSIPQYYYGHLPLIQRPLPASFGDPTVEFEARHSSRHHNLGGNGGDMQQTVQVLFLGMDPPFLPPVTLAAAARRRCCFLP